jgi:hypothetical protein
VDDDGGFLWIIGSMKMWSGWLLFLWDEAYGWYWGRWWWFFMDHGFNEDVIWVVVVFVRRGLWMILRKMMDGSLWLWPLMVVSTLTLYL